MLRTLLPIRQESRESSFGEVMDSFVLLAYASLVSSRTLLQRLLACLNFILEAEYLSFWYKQKSDFYELWQQHKQLKTMVDEWGLTWHFLWEIYPSVPTWIHSQNSLAAAGAPTLKISSHGTSLKWSRNPS